MAIAIRKLDRSVNDLFRERAGQVQCKANDEAKKPTRGWDNKPNHNHKTKVSSYKSKPVEKYSNFDLLEFFKDTCKECGVRFISNTNLDKRYMRNFKIVKDTFSNQEIVDMVKFLFESDQRYLAKNNLHPGILCTGWASKIFQDSQDFKIGTFNSNTKLKNREYSGDDTNSSVGEWE